MTKKIGIVLGLTLVLVIPLLVIEGQIKARSSYEQIAQQEVAGGWGEGVWFGSPNLLLNAQHVTPASSTTAIEVVTTEKKRGVFKVPVFTATLRSQVKFPSFPRPAKPGKEILLVPIRPSYGVQSFKVYDGKSGKELKATLTNSGLTVPLAELSSEEIKVEIVSRGTGLVNYESYAERDDVKMSGNWRKPQYVDDVLPTESKLTAEGFEANWTLHNLRTNVDSKSKSIGMNHLWVSTEFSKIERAVKYGILFILLTFTLILIVEFRSATRIHPFQYGLIGLAISIFYLLLLALSEVIAFDVAYATSSLAVMLLLGLYLRGFVRRKSFLAMILGEQVLLSTFFYVLLVLEERSFLVGTLGLFAALATFMLMTRKFDWYAGSFSKA